MERELPSRLSDAQRIVLSEFFAGRISAGQLTERLGIAVSEAAVDPGAQPQRAMRIPNPLRGLASRRSIAASVPPGPGTH